MEGEGIFPNLFSEAGITLILNPTVIGEKKIYRPISFINIYAKSSTSS